MRTTNDAHDEPTGKTEKLRHLKERLAMYEFKLAGKMKRYRGVIHESGLSEMRHNDVMVLRAMVGDLRREIEQLEAQ